jgi:hypothetical protein
MAFPAARLVRLAAAFLADEKLGAQRLELVVHTSRYASARAGDTLAVRESSSCPAPREDVARGLTWLEVSRACRHVYRSALETGKRVTEVELGECGIPRAWRHSGVLRLLMKHAG